MNEKQVKVANMMIASIKSTSYESCLRYVRIGFHLHMWRYGIRPRLTKIPSLAFWLIVYAVRDLLRI